MPELAKICPFRRVPVTLLFVDAKTSSALRESIGAQMGARAADEPRCVEEDCMAWDEVLDTCRLVPGRSAALGLSTSSEIGELP
jgi:hypothetical protein